MKILENNKSASNEEKKLKRQNDENKIIYIWKTTKLLIPTIAFKLAFLLSLSSILLINISPLPEDDKR